MLVEANFAETIKDMIRVNKEFLTMKSSKGDTAFTHACKFSELTTVQLFLNEFSSDIRETGYCGRNCFLSAASGGNNDTMKYLHSIDNKFCQAKDESIVHGNW